MAPEFLAVGGVSEGAAVAGPLVHAVVVVGPVQGAIAAGAADAPAIAEAMFDGQAVAMGHGARALVPAVRGAEAAHAAVPEGGEDRGLIARAGGAAAGAVAGVAIGAVPRRAERGGAVETRAPSHGRARAGMFPRTPRAMFEPPGGMVPSGRADAARGAPGSRRRGELKRRPHAGGAV